MSAPELRFRITTEGGTQVAADLNTVGAALQTVDQRIQNSSRSFDTMQQSLQRVGQAVQTSSTPLNAFGQGMERAEQNLRTFAGSASVVPYAGAILLAFVPSFVIN